MNLLRNTSIKRKQMLIITLTSTASLLLACVGFVLHDTATFRKELVEKNSSLAEVVGNSCSAALDFNDQKTAGELLTALRGEMNITDAFIMSRDGGEFASYHAGKQHSAPPKSTDMKNSDHVFTSDRLFLSRPIVQRDETLGTIIIVSDLAGLQKRMSSYVGIVFAVLAMSLLTTLLLSSRLQRVVSDPILHLAVTARKVAMEKNYSVRAVKQSDDEIGQLIDGFNEMLTQIQASNSALQLARDHLELRVQQRTAELADSFSLLNATIESTADGILVVDTQGHITSFNKRFATMWRLSQETLATRDDATALKEVIGQLKHPEQFLSKVRQLYAKPDAESHDFIEFKDGRVFERSSKPQLLDGRCVGRVWSFRDISERRRVEMAVVSSEERFRSVWEHSIEGMRLTDSQGRIVDVNKAFCKLVGLPREKLVGQPFSVTYFGHSPNDGIEVYRERFQTGNISPRIETKVTLWNSEELELEISSSLIESGNQGRMMLSIFRDVTERKRTEQELKRVQAELIQSSRFAGMAEVATNVLHNVGNVLNSVNTSASIVASRLKDSGTEGISRLAVMFETNRGNLTEFLSSSGRADQVIHYLKTLAQHLSTRQEHVLEELQHLTKNIDHIKEIVVMQQSYARVSGVTETINIADLVEDAVRITIDGINKAKVKLVRDYPASADKISADKHKILQILVNLIRNAKHACEDSGRNDGQLTLRIVRDKEQVSISVGDNGIGIPPENLNRIFNHGFTTRKDGHGFGLHSGALAAKEMGGSLSVESGGVGLGSTFTLKIPARPPNLDRDVKPREPSSDEEPAAEKK